MLFFNLQPLTFAVAILGENVATLPFELKSMFWSVRKQRAAVWTAKAGTSSRSAGCRGDWQLPPFLGTQVSAWSLVGSARRTERHVLLRRLYDTLGLQSNPATWHTGVLGEKYVGDRGLSISFLFAEY